MATPAKEMNITKEKVHDIKSACKFVQDDNDKATGKKEQCRNCGKNLVRESLTKNRGGGGNAYFVFHSILR